MPDGDQMFFKPEDFDQVHDRGGIHHRLKYARKWVPLGICPGEDMDDAEVSHSIADD